MNAKPAPTRTKRVLRSATPSRSQQNEGPTIPFDSSKNREASPKPPPSLEEMSKVELLEYIRSQEESGVRVSFKGKEISRKIGRLVQPRIVTETKSLGAGTPEDRSENLIIEGENLQAMVTLYRERGQVDLILTDPPYNTGADFRYNDRWDNDPNDPELGELVAADDGARHTKWMKFMWPRLSVMYDMLKPSGVLAICIDYRELFRLGAMLDEIFKEHNRLAIINWEKRYSTKSDTDHVSATTEYVLVYAKNEGVGETALMPRTAEMNARYSSPDGDSRDWASDNPLAPGDKSHPGMVYGIQSPFTGEMFYPLDGTHWRAERIRMKKWLEEWGTTYVENDLKDGRPKKALVLGGSLSEARKRAQRIQKRGPWPVLHFTDQGEGGPRLKRYLAEVKKGYVPTNFWADENFQSELVLGPVSWEHEQSGHTQQGLRELDAIVGKGHKFDTVKPLKLFSKVIQLWCPGEGLVMDPFAGSGTTAHAALALNAATGTRRRFILVEQGRPEKGDSYARTLTVDRLKRAVSGKWASGKTEPTGGGFKFWSLRNRVDAKAVLSMQRDEMTDLVIASHFDTADRRRLGLVTMTQEGYAYLVARNEDEEGFFLVWDGSRKPPVFNESVYDAVVDEALQAGLKPLYHVYARFNVYQSDDVRFYQIPDRILMDFGLSLSSDAFNNPDGES